MLYQLSYLPGSQSSNCTPPTAPVKRPPPTRLQPAPKPLPAPHLESPVNQQPAPDSNPAPAAPNDPAITNDPPPLLAVEDLHVHFPVRSGPLQRTISHLKAVDGVSFRIPPGQTLGIVGESGSGKTTIGRAILGLIPKTSGTIRFEDRPINWNARAARDHRRQMQIIFQDPGGSLNPRMRIAAIVAEPLIVHALARSTRDARDRVAHLLEKCGMPPTCMDRLPHEFSGGQKQRIAIARALALQPKLIICDEPTSALDVSVQAQIINLLKDLQKDHNLTYLFISHDMAVVQHIAHHVAVMKSGQIVEYGPCNQVLSNPTNQYTRRLLSAVPVPTVRSRHPKSAHTLT